MLEPEQLFFPLMINTAPPRLGIQLDGLISQYGWDQWIVSDRLYVTPLLWENAQPTPDGVVMPDYIVNNMRALQGHPVIISVKVAPAWARLWPDITGSPVKREVWDDFVDFLTQVAVEFGPWGIGLFNEPDVPAELSIDMRYYGGWLRLGDDPYEAGKYYGEFTSYVYSRFKERFPGRPRLIVLELCCDLQFARGAAAGGLIGDYVGLHQYIHQGDRFETVYRQAALIGQITGLPPVVTETNLLGDGSHRMDQAAYMRYLNHRQGQALPDDPAAVIVYALGNDWSGADLVHQGQAMPGYYEWLQEYRQ